MAMHLEITSRDREGVAILDFKGRITAGEEVGAFRSAFESIVDKTESKLILNLMHVDYIDSTGLGAMVMCSTRSRRKPVAWPNWCI